MKKSRFSIILKVANLDVCRSFYRNILDLGEPELDSSFRVEFRIGESFSLILEQQSPDEALIPINSKSSLSWKIQVKNLDTIKERLLDHGYEMLLEAKDRNTEFLLGCKDPEGNIFYLQSD